MGSNISTFSLKGKGQQFVGPERFQEGKRSVAQASLLKQAQAKACGYKKYLHDCNSV
jgi:hypothetical protein